MTEFPVKKFPVVVSYVYASISVCCLPGYLKLAICVSECIAINLSLLF